MLVGCETAQDSRVALWSAVIAQARTCYGTQNGTEWKQLEAQMQQRADQDEEYWKDAAYDARYCGKKIS